LEWRAANDRSRPGGLDFTKVEMLELSAVPVPALPTALATARSAGINLRPLVDWTERALDSKGGLYSERVLTMIRTAAGAATSYAAPRRSLVERAERASVARIVADPASGFRSFGEFLQAVARAGADSISHDSRLVRAPKGLNETDPTGGGFAVPSTYIESMVGSIYADSVIAPRCMQLETDRPADAQMPGIDETSRVDGSRWGGASAYWGVESDTVPSSLPRWRSINFSAGKLFAICVATNELLADAPMLGSYVEAAFVSELGFKLDAAILNGDGAGLPLGIMNSPALITVAKKTGQAGATIIQDNIEDMWQRLVLPARRRAVWLVNEDVEKQLSNPGSIGVSPTSAAIYIPTGAAGNEFPLLKGRPVLACEQAKPLGTPGDIVLADLTSYATVASSLKMDLSLDVNFVSDQSVFRFVWRIDGKPLWASPITPYNTSGLTRSPFVALAARA
jgi:HK97 family phage major capsid protein